MCHETQMGDTVTPLGLPHTWSFSLVRDGAMDGWTRVFQKTQTTLHIGGYKRPFRATIAQNAIKCHRKQHESSYSQDWCNTTMWTQKVCLSCLTSKLYLPHRAVGQKETIHRFTTFYYTLKDPLGRGWRRRSVWQLKIWHIHGDHGRLALCKWILRFVSVGCHGTRTVNVTGWTKYESMLPRQLLLLAIWPALKRTYSVFCANSFLNIFVWSHL